jgi:hypothetical protein
MENFDEAKNSNYYVCGMQPFDADDPMYGVIVAREGLEYHNHMEFEYYNNPKIFTSSFNAKLCAYCAGSSGADGFIDEELNVVWKSVLPVCQEGCAHGALPIARSRRRNGAQIENRAQRCHLTTTASQARDDVNTIAVTEAIEEDAVPLTTVATTTIPTATRVLRRGRQPREPTSGTTTPRTRKTLRPSTRRG